MNVLDRYVLRNFFYAFAVCLSIMMALIISLDLMINFDEFIERDPTPAQLLGDVFTYYRYQSTIYFQALAGLMAIVATAFTVGRMVRANELTALLASGLPLTRVLRPLGIASAICCALWLANAELLIPTLADRLQLRHGEISTSSRRITVRMIREDVNPPRGEYVLLQAAGIEPYRDPPVLRDLRVFGMRRSQTSSAELLWTIQADRAWWNAQRNVWILQRGIRRQATSARNDQRNEPIEVREFVTTLSPSEIMLLQQTQWIRNLSLNQLWQMSQRQDLARHPRAMVTASLHSRFTEPAIALASVLLAGCLFLRRGPANLVLQATKCILICGTIFGVQFIFSKQPADPALGAWLPMFLVAAALGYVYGSVKT